MQYAINDQPLNILFVTRDLFPPFRVDVAVLFGKEMVKRGHKIDWVLQSQDDCKKAYRTTWPGGNAWVGPTNNGVKFIHRLYKHMVGFFHNAACVQLLFKKSYDIIQVKDRFFTALLYLAAAKMFRTTYFFWLSYPFAEALLHESLIKSARYPWVSLVRGKIYKVLIYKLIMTHADHIFVQSEQMKRDIEGEGIPGEKMTVVPMGFDAEEYQTDIAECNGFSESNDLLENNDMIDDPPIGHPASIVYLGTLMKLRRIDFIIRVFSKVLKDIPDAKLYLIGAGETDEDIDFLKREARNLEILNAVIFTGFLARQKAMSIVRRADVCVSPFHPTPILNSTSPTKLVEYMALGKSVVANEHPEQKTILENSGGGLCVPYREKEFADAIVYLLTHSRENKEMGKSGRKWIFQHRSYTIIADKVERTYHEQLKRI